ncbi:MAG: zinc-dependent peptidase [Flavisolibacter sp.]
MAGLIAFISLFSVVYGLRLYGRSKARHEHYSRLCAPPHIDAEDIVIKGIDLDIQNDQLHSMLMKRFPYYSGLSDFLKKRFIGRLEQYMWTKTFIIKDTKGVKEMPVLVSAAAIQLTFGLSRYKMPFYRYIRIYPSEYFSDREFLKILAGNVQDNVISIAWNHVLDGYAFPNDGTNTPLHEMSHALYIQKLVINAGYAKVFHSKYHQLMTEASKAHALESKGEKDFYSAYAETDLQEFWAESVELFFEKPEMLAIQYPNVFKSMVLLLSQDPRKPENPLVKQKFTVKERLRKVALLLDLKEVVGRPKSEVNSSKLKVQSSKSEN